MRPLAEQPETEGRHQDRAGLAPLRRALSLPARLTRRLVRRDTPEPTAKLSGMSTTDLQRHLSITVITGHPDRKALAQHLKSAIRDWQAHNWEALGRRITRLDQTHSALPSGERLASALGRALFRHVAGAAACQIIDRGQCVATSDLPDDILAPLNRAISKPGTDPSIHFLTAQFNLEMGWARRGEAHSDFISDEALSDAAARFRVARDVLDGIVTRAPHSAYFAELDYRVLAAQGTAEDDLTRAATRWSRTDPASLTPFALHGLHLLPQWYGGEQSLALYADRVWSKTHEVLGTAGYAACYLSAMETEPAVIQTLDTDAFRAGLIDMIQDSEDLDVTCNAILRTLWEVSGPSYGSEGRDTAAMRRARQDIRDTFAYLVHHTLGPVMPDVWGNAWTEERILHVIGGAFETEISNGCHISIGLEGATIHCPD